MLTKTQFQIVHYLLPFLFLTICIFLPLKYIKYIAWMLIVVVFHWIIFNGCILDNFHHTNANIGTTTTDNITPILKLFNENLANYIHKKYLENTNRPSYITFFVFTLLTTVSTYRLIYNIEIIK